jgi:hypothetical protein
MLAACPANLIMFDLIILKYLVKSTDDFLDHVVLSFLSANPLSLNSPKAQVFSLQASSLSTFIFTV